MIDTFMHIPEYFKNGDIFVNNSGLNKVIKEYSFYFISKQLNLDQMIFLNENMKTSRVILIDQYTIPNQNDYFFIISLKRTIIIINQSSITYLSDLFSSNSNLPIYFLSDSKQLINKYIKIQNRQFEIDSNFQNEITNFKKSILLKIESNLLLKQKNIIFQIWKIISTCIIGYLIKQGYAKINEKQKNILSIENNNISNIQWSTKDYVELRNLGIGASFTVDLIYHFEKEELFALKKPNAFNLESSKLIEREKSNYSKINYPYLPKLYGTVKDCNNTYLIIQFINGQLLSTAIKNQYLNEDDKIIIIYKIMAIIEYFHKNNFVYRDLKPNNIIIDENENIFIIDFDRMIDINHRSKDEINTIDFSSSYFDPEINLGKISFSNDIYSIGQIIYFIMNNENPNKQNIRFQNTKLEKIYEICTKSKLEERPSISLLMIEFFVLFKPKFKIIILSQDIGNKNDIKSMISQNEILINEIMNDQYDAIRNIPKAQFNLGVFYYHGEIVGRDINKSIYYLTLASNQNFPQAQFNLGFIYYDGKFVERDINKSIYYYTLAANQNLPDAQYNLGKIYFKIGNFEKAIHYFTLAANQNYSDAQFNIGAIYLSDKITRRDINKSIHYLTLAANQNHSLAQYYLGDTFLNGKYIKPDINKSIHYLTLAANQKNLKAQFDLGLIYYQGKYVEKNINKSIYYFKLAADQNDSRAQNSLGFILVYDNIAKDVQKGIYYLTLAAKQNHFIAQHHLGVIYYNSEYVKRDIFKSINYLTLAADQNYPYSQYVLGIIYYEGIYIERDINKSIYYLTLAANNNLAPAQYNLSFIYYEGRFIERNMSKSIHYLTLAANQNFFYSRYILGILYIEGKFIKPDVDKSIHYLTLAADQNLSYAQLSLGLIFIKGEYIERNVNKSIKYFTLAANQNLPQAQHNLGYLFSEGTFIKSDIHKTIYYYTLAANQNYVDSQYNLGIIYLDDRFNVKDINKSIHFFTLAANQNHLNAQFNLGMIYSKEEYNIQDINKAVHYLTLAANQNHSSAQLYLGLMYFLENKIKQDINKSIYYITNSANQNNKMAQIILGFLYTTRNASNKDMLKGIDYFNQSTSYAKDNKFYKEANFAVGYFYHEGKYVKRDMKMSIHHYKEASSFNSNYAKNNLGIIYKNGIDDIHKNIGLAITYFDEAIRQKNDIVAMYNLAHIYIFEDKSNERINESIQLLLKSSIQGFQPSAILLLIAFAIEQGFNENDFNMNQDLLLERIIKHKKLDIKLHNNKIDFREWYQEYKNIDFIYNFKEEIIKTSVIFEKNDVQPNNSNCHYITSEFYEGFGKDLF